MFTDTVPFFLRLLTFSSFFHLTKTFIVDRKFRFCKSRKLACVSYFLALTLFPFDTIEKRFKYGASDEQHFSPVSSEYVENGVLTGAFRVSRDKNEKHINIIVKRLESKSYGPGQVGSGVGTPCTHKSFIIVLLVRPRLK